ncbi:hypothetical protein ABIB82_003896 [Bradyrhizobium sp. i1.8.4]|uniref:hypothetical protein n=1 Tax=unclassified Bradyrhizobium TaxID=2631580 RepID=UPI003D1E68F0
MQNLVKPRAVTQEKFLAQENLGSRKSWLKKILLDMIRDLTSIAAAVCGNFRLHDIPAGLDILAGLADEYRVSRRSRSLTMPRGPHARPRPEASVIDRTHFHKRVAHKRIAHKRIAARSPLHLGLTMKTSQAGEMIAALHAEEGEPDNAEDQDSKPSRGREQRENRWSRFGLTRLGRDFDDLTVPFRCHGDLFA